jgi:signal transduction histidine kinase
MMRFWALLFLILFFLAAAVLLMLHKTLRSRLSVRIAALILVAGPILLVAFAGFNAVTYGAIHVAVPWWSRLLQVIALIVGAPLVMGLLAARFVTKPLSQFNQAITSLKESNYQVELQTTGIREFDRVFLEFNDLIGRLRREEELRKNLISDTSHELNTPLSAMVSQLTAMEEGVLPITKARVRTLAQQTNRLTELVAQLNEYTRARSATAEHKEGVHLYTFCKELRDSFGTQLEENKMRLDINVGASYVVQANRQSLERIMANLIQNALRYSGGTTIAITAHKKQIIFSDDGRGVPAESLPYLFERFYRVDSSRSRETGGLGLGLAIVRELAGRQGWQMHAEDNHPGLAVVIDLAK